MKMDLPTFRIESIKMKLALTSLLVGSAAAFAPSKTASVSRPYRCRKFRTIVVLGSLRSRNRMGARSISDVCIFALVYLVGCREALLF